MTDKEQEKSVADRIVALKAEIFDFLTAQGELQQRSNEIEQLKQAKLRMLKELQDDTKKPVS